MNKWSTNLNSIDGFAPEQTFFTHLPFFENAKQLQTTPDEEIQLPEYKTYLICILEVWEKGWEKVPIKNMNFIGGFASEQTFLVLLFFGGAFSLVLQRKLLVQVARSLETPLLFKLNSKTMILYFG